MATLLRRAGPPNETAGRRKVAATKTCTAPSENPRVQRLSDKERHPNPLTVVDHRSLHQGLDLYRPTTGSGEDGHRVPPRKTRFPHNSGWPSRSHRTALPPHWPLSLSLRRPSPIRGKKS